MVVNVDWYFLLHWLDRARAAINSGYAVHLAVGITDQDNLENLTELGITVHPIPIERRGTNLFRELCTLRSIFKVIQSVKPDIVHTATIKPNIYGGIATRVIRTPAVVSFPGLGTVFIREGKFWALAKRLMLLCFRVLFDRSDCQVLFENGDDVTLYVREVKPRMGSVSLISGAGVDTAFFYPREQASSEFPVVLFAARIYKNKGLEELIEAVDLLRNKGKRLELQVAGILDEDADNNITLGELVDWESQGKLTWLGRAKNMPELIANSTMVCQPSLTREGLPRIILEAMSCGRPVITTNVPGCREAVVDGETGFLVEPGDVVGLASAIDELIGNSGLRKLMGAKARQAILSTYSTQIVQEKTLQIYESVL